MKPEKLIGKKVRGFNFESITNKCHFVKKMYNYIGKNGTINAYSQFSNSFEVIFEDGVNFYYPADQIESHLVEENEIPTLTDGVMMFVSDDGERWYKEYVIGKKDNIFYTWSGYKVNRILFWNYCKPIEPTKEEQLTKILGSSDKVAEIMELFKDKK